MASTGIIYRLVAHDSASRTFHQIGRAAAGTDSVMGKLARTAKLAGEALAVGLAAGLAESAKKAAEFQGEMTRISTQAGATAKDVKVLSDQVLKLGTTTQQGPQKLAESLYHLKSVGMDNVSAMKALKEAADLAAVGHADLEETTNALAGAWRTGIKGATSFHEAVSTVNAIIGAGNMSMEQFNAAIGTGILPSAKTFGLSLKQVGAALALMTDEGIDSASAATRLRMSFSLLGAPSGAAEKQLKKIGLTGLNLADAMRGPKGLIGAISLLKEHLDKSGLSASKQSQLLSRAFGGGRSSSGILLLLNNLDVLEKKQEQINRSTGKFDDAVKMQRKTAEAQWHLLVSNLEVMSVRIGTKVLPPLTDFVHFLATSAMPAASRFGKAMAGIIPVDRIKQGVKEVQTLVSDFFAGLSGKKGGGLLDLGAPSFSKNVPPSVIAHGLGSQKPTTSKVALPKNIPPSVAAHGLIPQKILPKPSDAKALGQQIRDAVTGGIADVDWSKVGRTLGDALGRSFQWLVKNSASLTKQLAKALGGLDWVDIGKQVGGKALGFGIGFVASFGQDLFSADFWKKHWWDTIVAALSVVGVGKLAGPIGKILSKIPILRWFAPLFERVGKLTKPLSDAFDGVVKFFGKHMWKGFAKVFPESARVIEREAGLLTTRIGVWGLQLLEKGKTAARFLGNGIKDGIGWVVSKVAELVARMLKPFAKVTGWLFSKGRSFVGGLVRGIAERAKGLGGWVWNTIAKPAIDAFRGAGSWLWSKGRSFAGGLVNGILNRARGIGGWAYRTMAKPVINIFKNAGSWLWSKGGALISGMKNGIVDKMKKIGDWVKTQIVDPVVGAVKHFFGIRSPSRVFMSIGGHLVSGLMKGMSRTSGTAIAKKVFGSLPKALASIVKKGLVSVSSLPGKALKALGGLGGDILGLFGLGGSGGGSSANQQIGEALAAARGWSGPQWAALKNLWNGESGWNERALNKSSGAYGIPQSLPASKMASAGGDWKTNPATQIKWGLSYIASRYGNPLNAYSAWLSRSPHWYAKGTGGAARGLAWVGERGPELVNFKGGEDVLSHPQSMAFAKANGIKLPGYASGTILNAADRVRRDKRRVADAKDDLARAKRRHKGVQAAEKRLKAAEKELQAAEIALKNARRSAKMSIATTIKNGLLKTLTTGTSSAIASALKSLNGKLLNAGFDKLSKTVMKSGDKLEKLVDKRASIEKTIAAAMQYAADQASNIRDFLSISGTSATSVGDLISQMTSQQKTASGFVSLTKSLQARGASKDLLAQLAEAGPGSQLAAILGDKSVTTQDIAKLNSLVKSGGKLATSFGQNMADLMYDSGKDAGKGFLAGLKSQEKALTKQITKLANDLVKAIKKALKIKSPSRVFRDEIGKNVVLGMAHGIDMHSHLVGSATQRLADTATGVSIRRRYVPTAARSSAGQDAVWERLAAAMEQQASQPQQLTGQLVLDSGELLGVIKGTVKPMIKQSENTQAYRAKVGRR